VPLETVNSVLIVEPGGVDDPRRRRPVPLIMSPRGWLEPLTFLEMLRASEPKLTEEPDAPRGESLARVPVAGTEPVAPFDTCLRIRPIGADRPSKALVEHEHP
jgi:hypothetical protein